MQQFQGYSSMHLYDGRGRVRAVGKARLYQGIGGTKIDEKGQIKFYNIFDSFQNRVISNRRDMVWYYFIEPVPFRRFLCLRTLVAEGSFRRSERVPFRRFHFTFFLISVKIGMNSYTRKRGVL